MEQQVTVFARNLTALRKQQGLSQRELANLIKVSVNTIQSYESGTHLPRSGHLIALANFFGCSYDWLLGKSEESGRFHSYVSVPLLEGKKQEVTQADADELMFKKTFLLKMASDLSNLALLEIHGPTMYPTLFDGDLVIIDQGQTTIHQGKLYAIEFEESITVNRLENRPGGITRIISDNQALAAPYEVATKQVTIKGAVIWLRRRLLASAY